MQKKSNNKNEEKKIGYKTEEEKKLISEKKVQIWFDMHGV
jgi:hypothetical protein